MNRSNHTPKRRIVLLGFDAATWNVIDPMIAKGELPNFEAVIKRGVRADLYSLDSPVSPRVWTSIVTGKTEDKHGVIDFYSNRSHLRSKRVWDIFNANDLTTSIFYWFVTWPPQKEIKGHMVPGFLSLDSQTIPAELSFLKELEMSEKNKIVEQREGKGLFHDLRLVRQALRFGVKPSTLLQAILFKIEQKFRAYVELDVFAKVQLLKLYLYRDVFNYMVRQHPTDFAAILYPQADQIGHKYWAYYEPDEYEKRVGIPVSERDRCKYGDVIPNIYREMDKIVGDMRNQLGEDDVLMILSDHGFGVIEEPKAQLKIKSDEFFAELDLTGVVHGFSIGPDYIIQINDKNTDVNDIAEKLRRIRLENEQESFFDVSINGTEIVLGLNNVWYMKSKDAMVLLEKNLCFAERSVKVADVVAHRSDISGDHEPVGVLIMSGSGIKSDTKISDCSVLDITPTLLYLNNLPVAKDMDGRPLLDAFTEDYACKNSVKYIETYEDGENNKQSDELDFEVSAEIQERLKGLGYLG